MLGVKLPILTLPVREQRWSCHGCGNCCRDFTVQLRKDDIRKLNEQRWEEKLGEPVTIRFRGTTFLRQRADGACMFLLEDGRCRIHAEFGFEEKPIACQLFPFHLTPGSKEVGGKEDGKVGGVRMGLNFACQSVLENKGAQLGTHQSELKRMAANLPELEAGTPAPMLTKQFRASQREIDLLTNHIDLWMRTTEETLATRLNGLAWIATSLAKAKLLYVREQRFGELLDLLFDALPGELELLPDESPTKRHMRLLRQAVFARTEDPKLHTIAKRFRLRVIWDQLKRSRQFARGNGPMPQVGHDWPHDIRLESIETIGAARDAEGGDAIDDLMTRYVRASVLGGRCWGASYYRWPMTDGFQALILNLSATGWLARAHAAGRGDGEINLEDVRAALGRVDRAAGRAPWLGSFAERFRVTYLAREDGLRRLVNRFGVVST